MGLATSPPTQLQAVPILRGCQGTAGTSRTGAVLAHDREGLLDPFPSSPVSACPRMRLPARDRSALGCRPGALGDLLRRQVLDVGGDLPGVTERVEDLA